MKLIHKEILKYYVGHRVPIFSRMTFKTFKKIVVTLSDKVTNKIISFIRIINT